MNDLYRGNAYANDPQFDAFTGRVAYQTSIVGMTDDGYKIRCIREYIDLGRAAPVDVGDPDAVIASEFEPKPVPKMQAKTAGFMARVRQELRKGPLSTRDLADALGETQHRVQSLIKSYPDDFEVVDRVGRGKMTFVYGLPGVPNGNRGE